MVRALSTFAIIASLSSTIHPALAENVRNVVCETPDTNSFARGRYRLKVTHWDDRNGFADIEWQRGNGDLYFYRTTFAVEGGRIEMLGLFDGFETWGKTQNVFSVFKFPPDFDSGMINMQYKGSRGGELEDNLRLFCY